VHAAEVWDPASGAWLTWASDAVSRVYHSTTLLLPDGRLLHAGSGDGANLPRELNAGLFTPRYLLHGARPTIAAAPAFVSYGRDFQVDTPDAGAVTRVTLVRLPSVTHAFDENQRFVPLALARSAGGLRINRAGERRRCTSGALHAVPARRRRDPVHRAHRTPAVVPAVAQGAIWR
jgi:hypothetical protein